MMHNKSVNRTTLGAMKHDPARSTPTGYWHFAAQYFVAAEAVCAAKGNLMFPALQLYGQSLELALKAFLLKRGASLHEVEQLRHRLTEILAAARRRRLGTYVKFSSNELALVKLLSENYAVHRFRYIVTGLTQVPQAPYVSDICRRLLLGLERYCTGQQWGLERHGA
jgi:HEPN domain-containing protein